MGFPEYRSLVRSVLASDRSKCKRQIPCWNVSLSDIYGMDSKMKWFIDGSKDVKGSRINILKVLRVYRCMQTHLYRGNMCGYGDIEEDVVFGHKMQQSLAAALSEIEIQ